MATRAQEAALKPRHRVLIVDDEESTRVLLARLLSKELNVEAQLAGTCEQALKLAGNYAYDAILLDLLMPGIGGLGVLAALRAASPNATTPVIIVSVVAEQETVDRCMAELARLQASLAGMDPTAVLERGYSITRAADGTVLRDAARIAEGDEIFTTLARGGLRSKVKKRELL